MRSIADARYFGGLQFAPRCAELRGFAAEISQTVENDRERFASLAREKALPRARVDLGGGPQTNEWNLGQSAALDVCGAQFSILYWWEVFSTHVWHAIARRSARRVVNTNQITKMKKAIAVLALVLAGQLYGQSLSAVRVASGLSRALRDCATGRHAPALPRPSSGRIHTLNLDAGLLSPALFLDAQHACCD